MSEKIKIDCREQNCSYPALEYSNGEVIAFNEHRGKKHINKIPLENIIKLALKDGSLKRVLEKLKKSQKSL